MILSSIIVSPLLCSSKSVIYTIMRETVETKILDNNLIICAHTTLYHQDKA